MNATEANAVKAVRAVLRNYTGFSGRATRPEYWWFVAFTFTAGVALMIIDLVTGTGGLWTLFTLGTFLPSLAVTFRRLHDTGRAAWWLLIVLVPFLGPVILVVWAATAGDPGPNKYGLAPART